MLFKLLLLHGSLEWVSLCASPLREAAQFPPFLWVHWTWASLVFKARCFEGLSLCCRSPGLAFLMWSTNPLLFRENSGFVRSLPILSHCAGGGVFGERPCLYLPYSSQCGPFTNCEETVQLFFMSFSEGSFPYVAVGSVCPWAVNFRIFLCQQVEPPPKFYLKIQIQSNLFEIYLNS